LGDFRKRINITHAATVFGVAGVLGIASFALAADQKPATTKSAATITDPATLARFDHVKVVAATPEQLAAIAHERSTGALAMKVAVDPVTLKIRQFLPEDAAATTPAAQAPSTGPVEITTPSGVQGMVLDESFMAYAVAHRAPDGKVRQACLENQKNDETALKAAVAATGVNNNEK